MGSKIRCYLHCIRRLRPTDEFDIIFFNKFVCIPASTLLTVEREIIMGILIEEFLHYTYKSKLIMNQIPLTPKPDKEELEPISEWFEKEYYIRCFEKAQLPPQEGEITMRVNQWTQKGYPVVTYSYFTEPIGNLEFKVPKDIVDALKKRDKINW